MAASSAGHAHQPLQQQQQSQPAALKSSVAKLARLFLGKSKKHSQHNDKPAGDATDAGGAASYYCGSLARQPGSKNQAIDSGGSCRQRGSHKSRWLSQEGLTTSAALVDIPVVEAQDHVDYGVCGAPRWIEQSSMSRSVHADFVQQPLPGSQSTGCISAHNTRLQQPLSQQQPPGLLPVPPRRIVVVDRADVAASERKASLAAAAVVAGDSTVGPEGQLLRAKQRELETMRVTMEQNEAALLRVFEERRLDLEARLESARALGTDLAPAVAQANRRIRESERSATELRDEVARRAAEAHALRSRLRATEAEALAQGELARGLERELSTCAVALETATRGLQKSGGASTASGVRVDHRGCQTTSTTAEPPSEEATAEQLRAQVAVARQALFEQTGRFESERSQWLTEKSQVVTYQKQLQLNLLQLTRKVCQLEADVKQLGGELLAKEAQIARLTAAAALSTGGATTSSAADSGNGTAGSRSGVFQC